MFIDGTKNANKCPCANKIHAILITLNPFKQPIVPSLVLVLNIFLPFVYIENDKRIRIPVFSKNISYIALKKI